MKASRVAILLAGGLAALAALWTLWPEPAPPPALLAGLSADGLRGAPCPARSIYEQNARKKHGALPETQLGRRLRQKFPLGSDAGALSAELKRENFGKFSPCANDESVFGARWLSPDWTHPDGFVYWSADDNDKLTYLDGYVSRDN